MTKLKVTEEIGDSIFYIISHFNANEINFLYENYRTLNEKHNLFALKYIKKEDLIRCFLDGYIVLKALGEKDLGDSMTVFEPITNLTMDIHKVGEYYLGYSQIGDDYDSEFPFPYTVDMVLNLINTGSWEIVNKNEVSNG